MARKSTAQVRTRSVAPTKGASRKQAPKSPTKHVGDVLGISRARVPSDVPRATADRGGRPKGIEVGRTRRAPRQARTVGGVRGRGR